MELFLPFYLYIAKTYNYNVGCINDLVNTRGCQKIPKKSQKKIHTLIR